MPRWLPWSHSWSIAISSTASLKFAILPVFHSRLKNTLNIHEKEKKQKKKKECKQMQKYSIFFKVTRVTWNASMSYT